MEQMPSRRRANQREVVRNRNQDSVQDEKTCYWNWRARKDEPWMWKYLGGGWPECKSWWASNIFWNLCSAPKARIVHRPWRDEDRWEKTGLRAAGRSTHIMCMIQIQKSLDSHIVEMCDTHWWTLDAWYLWRSAGSSDAGRGRREGGGAQGWGSKGSPTPTQRSHRESAGTPAQREKILSDYCWIYKCECVSAASGHIHLSW